MIFQPKSGQVDFTDMRWAPVINCVVSFNGKILIVKRSAANKFYPEHWNGISGFLDDHGSLEEKVKEELEEEIGVKADKIVRLKLGRIFDQEAPDIGKTWVVHPVAVEISSDEIVLNDEAREYAWIAPQDATKYKLLPGFLIVLESIK